MPEQEPKQETPRGKTFISYSQTDLEGQPKEDHKEWVFELADRLRHDSFEVILDQTHLQPGHDQYKFMEQSVADSTVQKVIMIIDPSYAQKATTRTKGVGIESQIISPEIYGKTEQTKFLVVIREKDENGHLVLPPFLKHIVYIDMSTDELAAQNYEQLTRALANKPLRVPSPLGALPSYLAEEPTRSSPASSKIRAADNAVRNAKATAGGLVEDAFDALKMELQSLQIESNLKVWEELDPKMFAQYEAWLPIRNELLNLIKADLRFADGRHLHPALPRFLESTLPLFRVPSYGLNDFQSHIAFAMYELILATTALMLEMERFEALGVFLSARYRHPDSVRAYDRSPLARFPIFRVPGGNYFEKAEQRDCGHRAESPSGQLLQKHFPESSILSFTAICEADVFLCVRDMVDRKQENEIYDWLPMTSNYVMSRGHQVRRDCVEFLDRIQSPTYLQQIMPALGVSSPKQLLSQWTASYKTPDGQIQFGFSRLEQYIDTCIRNACSQT